MHRSLFVVFAVLVFVSGCREVEVKTGSRTVCEKCDNEIANNVQTKLVASTEADKYMVEKLTAVCNNCRPSVKWGIKEAGAYESRKFVPVCPYCKGEVGLQSTTCRNCSKEYKWAAGSCSDCSGQGKLQCSCATLFKGKCIWHAHKPSWHTPQDCPNRNGCHYCRGTLEESCLACGGRGQVG